MYETERLYSWTQEEKDYQVNQEYLDRSLIGAAEKVLRILGSDEADLELYSYHELGVIDSVIYQMKRILGDFSGSEKNIDDRSKIEKYVLSWVYLDQLNRYRSEIKKRIGGS